MAKARKIILGVTGSIAAYRAADLIRSFKVEHVAVTVVMTKAAAQFITPLTLASLSGGPVYAEDQDSWDRAWQMPHIRLAQEAQALLIAPATAHTIGKMAAGLCDDLLCSLALTMQEPIFVAPAMNATMYQHPQVQKNCQRLRQQGIHFIEPIEGELACGDTGTGHIAETSDIVQAVLKGMPT